jgi:hypothetical protein
VHRGNPKKGVDYMKLIKVKCGHARALILWFDGRQLTIANSAAKRMFG